MPLSVYSVNAFTSENADGNPTMVVFLHEPVDSATCAAFTKLRARDTVFLLSEGPEAWRARFFTPRDGEVAFCGQGLLAAARVLREQDDGGGSLTLRTRTGRLRLAVDVRQQWIMFPRGHVRPRGESSCVPSHFSLSSRDFETHHHLVDNGRDRVFLRATSPETLERLRLMPAAVLDYCERNHVAAVCFYAHCAEGTVALRVFTQALCGEEDVSTGGAVLGLATLLESRPWRIDQGHRSRIRRTLFLKPGNTPGELAVGGHTEVTLHDMLDS